MMLRMVLLSLHLLLLLCLLYVLARLSGFVLSHCGLYKEAFFIWSRGLSSLQENLLSLGELALRWFIQRRMIGEPLILPILDEGRI